VIEEEDARRMDHALVRDEHVGDWREELDPTDLSRDDYQETF
jgi:hypothetical protein